MTTEIIPKGYKVSVTTWENDADNYRTESISGLNDIQAQFVIDLCKLHRSRNDHRYAGPNYGNMYEPSSKEVEKYEGALSRLIARYEPSQLLEGWDDPEAIREDLAYELGLTGGDFFTRVFEEANVLWIPEDIVLEGVTEKFM